MKIDVKSIVKSISVSASKHAPEILTGMGIASMLSAVVLAVKATPTVEKNINEAHANTFIEKVKISWKPYLPAGIAMIFGTSCLIGSTSVALRRNTILATAYELSEATLNNYTEKVKETVGETKERQIREEIAASKAQDGYDPNNIIHTKYGEVLCKDLPTGRYFTSNIDRIRLVAREIIELTNRDDTCDWNEFYYRLGLEETTMGDILGWTRTNPIDISYGSALLDDGRTCMTINYRVYPTW